MDTPFAKLIHRKEQLEKENEVQTPAAGATGVCIGLLVSVEKNGQIKVDFPANPNPPVSARSIIRLAVDDRNREILLAFERGNLQRPIIVGFIEGQPVSEEESKTLTLSRDSLEDVVLDKQRIILDAREEIILRCGEGSVKLRKDGAIIIKGTKLISRAKTTNKIKGASVAIN